MITFSESQQKIVDALEAINNATNGDVLDKIRAEIEQERQESKDMDDRYAVVVIGKILEIIDKHTKGDNE